MAFRHPQQEEAANASRKNFGHASIPPPPREYKGHHNDTPIRATPFVRGSCYRLKYAANDRAFAFRTGHGCLPSLHAQQAGERFKAAEATLTRHLTTDHLLNDDSAEARDALRSLWEATGVAVVEAIAAHAHATSQEIDQTLCASGMGDEGCETSRAVRHNVAPLGKGFYAVAAPTINAGGVLVVGPTKDGTKLVWSMADASVSRSIDPRDLIGAWRVERTGDACREPKSGHKPGSCGPLYPEVGLLPSDGAGRPRFYVDAQYEQGMGATIAKQTSVWRWDGDRAELLWVGIYPFMLDETVGTHFDDDTGRLEIAEKGEFKTMFSCGACIDRPLVRSLFFTDMGVEDLGERSLVPELDVLDRLFQAMQQGKSVAGLASPQVTRFLKEGIAEAKAESRTIAPHWFTIGMFDATTVQLTKAGAKVCLSLDSSFDPMDFTLRSTRDGGFFVSGVSARPANKPCPRGLSLPAPEQP